ncbi:MAG: phosphoglucosamine mutase [Halobacteriaceae archaeon]
MFGTSGVRGPVGDAVTAELALDVGRAVATDGAEAVILGRDPRESGDVLADAVASGLRECGADVVDVGVAATPSVARAVAWRDADAGVVVTASHNPPEDNGLKLWTPSGQAFDSAAQDRITDIVERKAFDLRRWDGLGDRTEWDGVADRHREELVSATAALDGLSVVVDVGNGAGGVVADALYELGASVETLNAQRDGRFPGRPSEPTAETCETLARTVAATDADLGVAHDGDADRCMAVDETGTFVPGDVLLALFARAAAAPGERVAAPVDTSLVVDDVLADQGVSVTRTRVGDVYVAEAASDPDVAFGGEPSGAWIFPEETLCPDGPRAACRLAELVSEGAPLSDQVADVGQYPIRRTSVEVADKAAVMDAVAAAVAERYDDVTTLDGVRVGTDDGWFLVRASGTQPLVRVSAEAREEDRAEVLFEEARSLVADASGPE